MRTFKLLTLIVLATFLMGNTSCDQQIEDAKSNPEKYKTAGKDIYKKAKETELSGTTLEKTRNIVDSAKEITTTLNFIPGAQSITTPLTIGLGLLSTALTFFVAREKKKVKVITERAEKSEAVSNNYREGLEAGINEGDDQKVVDIKVLKTVFDKDTKAHFNGEGVALI